MGLGTSDSERALGYLKRFGSVTVLNGHIHQVLQKVEGNVTFHTAIVHRFPAGRTRRCAVARPVECAGGKAAQHARPDKRSIQTRQNGARGRRLNP